MDDNSLTWVVLAGGRGTRSENPELPKVLQSVGQQVVLDFLVDSLGKQNLANSIFVISHGAEQVKAAVQLISGGHSQPMVFFDKGRGPVDALISASSIINSKYVGVILGDTLISAPLPELATKFITSGYKAAITVRQSDHLYDSDAVTVDYRGNVTSYSPKSKQKDIRLGQIWGVTGVLFLSADLIGKLDSSKPDIVNALFSLSSVVSSVKALKTCSYFRDSGTPDRIRRIRADYESGMLVYPRLPGKRPCVFIDRDGTLFEDLPLGRKVVQKSELFDSTVSLIRESNKKGVPVIMVSNQPAIAKGFIDFGDVYCVHNVLQSELLSLGAKIDDFYFCPHHPETGFCGEIQSLKTVCQCRKPATGLFETASEEHGLLLNQDSILVGDSESDSAAAETLGLKFIDVLELNSKHC